MHKNSSSGENSARIFSIARFSKVCLSEWDAYAYVQTEKQSCLVLSNGWIGEMIEITDLSFNE